MKYLELLTLRVGNMIHGLKTFFSFQLSQVALL